ncbi:peptidase S8/S53 domain-containing protein [Paraphysoderma sedebokerense]|nr:peptidase S8/S53 domain-containing protein [Paraphysoderma sedebokerense]
MYLLLFTLLSLTTYSFSAPASSDKDCYIVAKQLPGPSIRLRARSTHVDHKPVNLSIACVNSNERRQLEAGDDVLWVEESKPAQFLGAHPLPQNGSRWSLDMLDGKRDNILNLPDNPGKDVDIYFIDSGILVSHQEFGGRAKLINDVAVDDPKNGDPVGRDGHGTISAGVAAGNTTGVARQSNIFMIRISGTQEGKEELTNIAVVKGVELAVKKIKDSKRNAIINMSLAVQNSTAVDTVVRNAVAAGIPVVVSAPNGNGTGCHFSPAREPTAITVTSAARNNTIAGSGGKCVDIIAPGDGIVSASARSPNEYHTTGGTSFATPLVTGVGAVMLGRGVPPSQLRDKLVEAALKGAMKGDIYGSPNVLLQLPKF